MSYRYKTQKIVVREHLRKLIDTFETRAAIIDGIAYYIVVDEKRPEQSRIIKEQL